MNRPTRFYSNRQEKAVAKALGGRQQPNSGATAFYKGDIITDNFLMEAKTKIGACKSFTIQREWLDKIAEEAFAMNKRYSALVFDFGDDSTRYYVIDEKTFIKLMEE